MTDNNDNTFDVDGFIDNRLEEIQDANNLPNAKEEKKEKINKGGAPKGSHNALKYKPEYVKIAYNCAKAGRTVSEMCEIFGLKDDMTFYRWIHKYPDFKEAVNSGRLECDARLVDTLYQLASKGGKRTKRTVTHTPDGKRTYVDETIQEAPDMRALAMWLKTRQRGVWSEAGVLEDSEVHPNAREHTVNINIVAPDTKIETPEQE